MRIVVETKPDPLLKQLLKQFEGLQRTLMTLKSSSTSDPSSKLLQVITKQQDSLVKALDRLMKQVSNGHAPSSELQGVGKRLDRLVDALGTVKRSRHRTFGSNY